MTQFVVTINPDLLDFRFIEDEKGAEQFADELNHLVLKWIPYCQMAAGLFAEVTERGEWLHDE